MSRNTLSLLLHKMADELNEGPAVSKGFGGIREHGQFELGNRGTKKKYIRDKGNIKQLWGSREQNTVKGRTKELKY